MPNHTFTIILSQLAVDVTGRAHGYQDKIPDPDKEEAEINNPETKQKYAERMIRKGINNNLVSQEVNAGVKSEEDKIRTKAKKDFNI